MSTGPNKRREAERRVKQSLMRLRVMSSDDEMILNGRVGMRIAPLESRLDQLGLLRKKSIQRNLFNIYDRVATVSGDIYDRAAVHGFTPEESIIVKVLDEVNNPAVGDHYAHWLRSGFEVKDGYRDADRILLDNSHDAAPGSYHVAIPHPDLGHIIKPFMHVPVADVIDGVFTGVDMKSTLVVGRFYDLPAELEVGDLTKLDVGFAGANAWLMNRHPHDAAEALSYDREKVHVLDELDSGERFGDDVTLRDQFMQRRDAVEEVVLKYLQK